MGKTIQIPHNWEPRGYQLPLWLALEGGYKRAVAVWHRRAGKDSLSLHWTTVAAMQRVGTYWHMLPTLAQGRKVIWDGINKDGSRVLDAWPEDIRSKIRNDEMKIELVNGSIWQVVGSDNYNSLVGSNPVGVVFSEYSLADPAAWDFIRPILAENGGWALFIYTPRGRNHGFEMMEMARGNDKWFAEVLTANDTDAIPLEDIEEERLAGMPEEIVQQEFFCSFDAALVGAYYGQGMAHALEDGRIGRVPWEPAVRVNTAWDLGMGDSTSIWFFQEVGREIRAIDYYEASGEGLAHYAKVLQSRPYVYGQHIAPHDIAVRELGTGRSRMEVAKDLGIQFEVAPNLALEDGIEAVRNMLPRMWFDATKCNRAIEALRQYQKGWNEKQKCFSDRPLHDWTSHAADALRMYALARGKVQVEDVVHGYEQLREQYLIGQQVMGL